MFSFACGAVSWLSKKQATVALSTAEAEHVALSTATQESILLRRLLADVGEPPEGPTEIYEDNQGAISMAKNPVGHARTKHIDIRYHFVREGVQDGAISSYICWELSLIGGCPLDSLVKVDSLHYICRIPS